MHIERDQEVGYALVPYVTYDNKERPIKWEKESGMSWDKDYAEGGGARAELES